jgi:catalase (peroxidase I)
MNKFFRLNRIVLTSRGRRTFVDGGSTATIGVVGAAAIAALVGYNFMSKPSIDYNAVKAEIASRLDDDDWDDGSWGPVLIRLAWHASGSYCTTAKNGGSNGATMRFAPESDIGANAGLQHARDFLEPVKAKFPDISYADLWILAGNTALEEMGCPPIPFTPGRTDDVDGTNCPPDGRLPDGDKGAQHVRDIFYRQGFNDQEIVALVGGGHALGRCHTDRSGFTGPWTRAPTTFSNEYFRELLDNTWTPKKWNGPPQLEDPTGDLMMLLTDYAMIEDPEMRKWCVIYRDDYDRFANDFVKVWVKLTQNGYC